MKSFLKISFLLSSIILLLSSCGKKNEVGKLIPNNALFVAQVNVKSLSNKLSWNEIKQTAIYQKIYADSSAGEWKRKILDNPSASGIDFDEGLVFFVVKHPGEQYVAAEGKIKSQIDFENFNKNLDPAQTIRKQGNISLLTLKDKNVVGWNDDHFVYVANPKYGATGINGASDIENEDLSSICTKLFSLKSDSSLAGNDQFASLLKESGDAHLWQNTEAIVNSSTSMGMLGMMKLDAFTKDNISTYTINFDKGKINVAQKMYFSKDLADVVKKYMGSSINMDMIKKIPSQNIFGIFSFNFKPQGIAELIKLTGADGLVNNYAQQLGFNLDDFSKATNGDWLLAFSDLKISQDSGKVNPTGFNYIFATGISDKAALQKIINAAKKTTSAMQQDTMINYVSNDKTLVISNSNSFGNQYLTGNANNKFDFADKISGHPVAFYLDLHKLLTEFSASKLSNSSRKGMLDEALKTWENVISTGGEFKDNGFTFTTNINLINKDTNSLKQISHYLDKMYQINEEERKENPGNLNSLDSLLNAPSADTVK